MALIKITDIATTDLENTSLEQGYFFKDLFLDLETSVYYNRELHKPSILKAVQGSYDEHAIKNSIEEAKNVDMSPRQSHGEIEAGGIKVRVLGDTSEDFKFRIKNKNK